MGLKMKGLTLAQIWDLEDNYSNMLGNAAAGLRRTTTDGNVPSLTATVEIAAKPSLAIHDRAARKSGSGRKD
jgi:hypothetical protein